MLVRKQETAREADRSENTQREANIRLKQISCTFLIYTCNIYDVATLCDLINNELVLDFVKVSLSY